MLKIFKKKQFFLQSTYFFKISNRELRIKCDGLTKEKAASATCELTMTARLTKRGPS